MLILLPRPLSILNSANLKSLALITTLIVCDQGLKAFFIAKNQAFTNKGGIFSIPASNILIVVTSIVLILGIEVLLLNKNKAGDSNQLYKENYEFMYWPLVLIVSGGLSNLIDRVLQGGVVDIWHAHLLMFNLADIYIVVATAITGWAFMKKIMLKK